MGKVTYDPVGLLEEGVELLGRVVGVWDWVCGVRLDQDGRQDGGDVGHGRGW